MSTQNKYAPASPHDPLVEIFPDIYLLRGSIKIGFGLRMNRNMIIIRQQQELILINPVRMSADGLAHLEQLGRIRHIIRLGDFHGLDDQFYRDTYQAQLWSQAGHHTYKALQPDRIITAGVKPPIENATFFIFTTAKYPEAALLIQPAKLLITTDSVQYWADWKYTSFLSRMILWLMGFRLGLFIGAPWLKRVTPKGGSLKTDFQRLLQLDFDSLVAAHGSLLQATAKHQLEQIVMHQFSMQQNNKSKS